MRDYFVQALIISTLYKAVHLTAMWGGYYCCFHFTDDEAEAHQQGVCVTGPGNHPIQCLDSGSWACVFNCIFLLGSQHHWRAIAMSWKLLPKDMRLQNLNGIIYFDSKLKFHFLHLCWLWVERQWPQCWGWCWASLCYPDGQGQCLHHSVNSPPPNQGTAPMKTKH